ncbi:MAG: Gfo/Idh/MocA family oxidoreductase [Acidobacteria bacterium]|nr:Gfo/Idh/MocA family oxidoreductase [Acidobacteriota bacterium]
MSELNFAVLGAGYWAQFQLAAWREVEGARCVAIYNRTRSRAEALAQRFGIPSVYDDAENLLERENLDFIDIITDNRTHCDFVKKAAGRRLPVICQKPMAPTIGECIEMVEACRAAGIPFLVHENWRWQTPIRALKQVLDSGAVGRPVRARITVITSADDYQTQPFLKELERMVLADMGVHLLDTARFLFGEAAAVYCQTIQVQSDLKGEDMATVMMRMDGAMTVSIELAFARIPIERDHYIQTLIFVEGQCGSIELGPDYWIRITTAEGTYARRHPPRRYPWGDPLQEVCTSSIVECHRDLLAALSRGRAAETTAEDNLKTMRLMEACYESASRGSAVCV